MHRLLLALVLIAFAPLPLHANERLPVDEDKLRSLKASFEAYAAQNGAYPRGDNADIVRQMKDSKKGISFVGETDSMGRITSSAGIPIVFLQSADGWVVIAIPNADQEEFEREITLPPFVSPRSMSRR